MRQTDLRGVGRSKPFMSILPAVLALTIAACGTNQPGEARTADGGPIREVWRGLINTQNQCSGTFDYHPNGGMRIWACHVVSLMTVQALQTLAGVPIFIGGPHDVANDDLKLNEENTYGHYNPAFVTWATENLIPGADDQRFRFNTQRVYDQYVAPLARVFWATSEKAINNPACFEREVERFETLTANGELPFFDYERYFYFMNNDFCDTSDPDFNRYDNRYDGNVVKTSIAFWIRRSADGTFDEFRAGLEKLIDTYGLGEER